MTVPAQDQASGTPAPGVPAFDVDALAAQIGEKLKDSFTREAPPASVQPPVTPPAKEEDPVDALVRPYTARAERMAVLAEESASDAVEFYGAHPSLSTEERKEIERRFKALKANGVPFKREDIYNHYIGENIDKVVEQRIKKRQEEADRAANASATVGAGSPDKNGPSFKDAFAMSTADLEKALAGQSF